MPRLTTLTVRIGESLSNHISSEVGDNGTYDNVSEYIRDLIRKDKEKKDELAFNKWGCTRLDHHVWSQNASNTL